MAASVVTFASVSNVPKAPATGAPDPGSESMQLLVNPAAGNWLYALVAWRQVPGLPSVTWNVADDAHNWWDPVGAPFTTSDEAGTVRTTIWRAPAVRTWPQPNGKSAGLIVTCAASGIYASGIMFVLEATGMLAGVQDLGVATHRRESSTGFNMSIPDPGAPAIYLVSGAAADVATSLNILGGGGWSVSTATATNGVDTTADLQMIIGYNLSSPAPPAQLTSSNTDPLAATFTGNLTAQAPPAQPQPSWPFIMVECAPGAGQATTPDRLAWQPVPAAVWQLDSWRQGRTFELSDLSTGEGTLTVDNPNGQMLPPGSQIQAGTPVRIRACWQGGKWQAQFTGDGVTATPQMAVLGLPVVPGQSYSFAAWLACSVPYASGVHITLRWKDGGGNTISDVQSAAVTTAAPVLATASGPAPPNAATVNVIIAVRGTPPASTVFTAAGTATDVGYINLGAGFTGWTAQNNAVLTVLGAWGYDRNGPPSITPWYIPVAGFFERVPQGWDAQYRGVAACTINDTWFSLQENLNSILAAELLNDAPYALWPCTDPAGSGATGAANIAPGNTNVLLPVVASLGDNAGSTSAFGQNAGVILGAGGTLLFTNLFRVGASSGMWGQSFTSQPATGFGRSLACTDSNYPPVAGGVTVETWFQESQLTGEAPVLSVQAVNGGGFSVYLDSVNVVPGPLWLDATGTNTGTGGAGPHQVSLGSTNFLAAPKPFGHVAVTFDRNTYTVYVNGTRQATGSWFTQLPPRFSALVFNGLFGGPLEPAIPWSGSTINSVFGGFTGWCGVWPRILSRSRIATHYQAGAFALAGEAPSARLERLLQVGTDSPLRRHIQADTGTFLAPVVSAQDIPGAPESSALTHIAANVLPGIIFVAPTGDICYLARQNAWNQPVRWTAGENLPAGEIPLVPMPLFSSDPTKTINQIQLTQLDRQTTVAPQVPAIEQASANQAGTITWYQTGYLQNDGTSPYNAGPSLIDLANYLATTFSGQPMRGEALKIDAAQHPAAWPLVLGASVGDIVVVNRRPVQPGTAAPQISVTGRISQTTRALSFGYQKKTEGSIQLLADPAPETSALLTGDPVRGLLNGQNILAW